MTMCIYFRSCIFFCGRQPTGGQLACDTPLDVIDGINRLIGERAAVRLQEKEDGQRDIIDVHSFNRLFSGDISACSCVPPGEGGLDKCRGARHRASFEEARAQASVACMLLYWHRGVRLIFIQMIER